MAKREWNSVATGYKPSQSGATGSPTTSGGGRQRSNLIEDEDAPVVRRYRDDEEGSLFDRYPGPRS